MRLTWLSHSFNFPAQFEPEWGAQVERWYQLDAAAFGVAEVYWRHRDKLERPPAWMFLASPGGSNITDHQFARTNPSPAKFVHTLPNIRSAALLQLMKWSGPVFCIQKDPQTIMTALGEALALTEDGGNPAWVVSVTGGEDGFTAHIFILNQEGPLKIGKSPSEGLAKGLSHDKHLCSWLKNQRPGSELWIG